MRILALIHLFLVSLVCQSQSFDELKDGNETYFQYIAVFDSSMTKGSLFDMFNLNLMKTYKNTLVPSDIKDEGDSKLFAKCKGNKLVYNNGIKMDGGFFTYNLNIICKDGKAKIVINAINYNSGEMVQMKSGTNFTLDEPDNWNKSFMWNKQSKKEWGKMKDQFRNEINAILKNLIKVDNTISDDF